MGIFTINLPDIGEGIAEAELDEWTVKVGDIVAEDDVLCSVMTDKAVVEVPTSIAGKIDWIAGEEGDTLAIGAPLVRIHVEGVENTKEAVHEAPSPPPQDTLKEASKQTPSPKPPLAPAAKENTIQDSPNIFEKPLAAPSVRKEAQDKGADLRAITGTGPANRITHEDLSDYLQNGPNIRPSGNRIASGGSEIKVKGMRRVIADKMALSKDRIPHITIVEEVDVTELEGLRSKLNGLYADTKGKLTLLPFVMAATVKGVAKQPAINATYDDEQGIIQQQNAVHIGIATQTPNGLTVPVVNHAEAGSLWENAAELVRLSKMARDGTIKRENLSGSTITITSLGPLGAVATTPIINHPEVAIVSINKMAIRPMWDGAAFQPRKMMNISCSFDHRVIDGWDAALFVQCIKSLLETPTLLFIEA